MRADRGNIVSDFWTIRDPMPWWLTLNHAVRGTGPESITLELAINPEQVTVEFSYLPVIRNPDASLRIVKGMFSVDHGTRRLDWMGATVS